MDERQISFFQHSNTPSRHYSQIVNPKIRCNIKFAVVWKV